MPDGRMPEFRGLKFTQYVYHYYNIFQLGIGEIFIDPFKDTSMAIYRNHFQSNINIEMN